MATDPSQTIESPPHSGDVDISLSTDAELRSFLDHVTWLFGHWTDVAVQDFVVWLAGQLKRDDRTMLEKLMLLDAPVRVRAERSVVELLERKFTRRGKKWRALDIAERNVNWAVTYAKTLTPTPMTFWAEQVEEVPNERLLRALAGLARMWLQMLNAFGSKRHESRKRKLQDVLARPEIRRIRSVAYGRGQQSQLRRIDPDAASAIRRTLSILSQKLASHEGLQTQIASVVDYLLADNSQKEAVYNALFEITIHLAIARAATMGTQSWHLESLPPSHTRTQNYSPLLLRSESLVCEITKERLDRILNASLEDRTNVLRTDVGLSAKGHQPDIVLKFTSKNRPSLPPIFALGDAKRNSGTSYIRKSLDVAVVYLVAWGHTMGLSLGAGPELDFGGPLHPAFTLFFRRDVDSPGLLSLFQGENRLPSIVSMDFESHFGPTTVANASWTSPVLTAWITRLAEQAQRHFEQHGEPRVS